MKIAFVYDEIPNDEIISQQVHGKHLKGLEDCGNICAGFTTSYSMAIDGAFRFIEDTDTLCREVSAFAPDVVYIEGVSAKAMAALLGAGFNCRIRINGDETVLKSRSANNPVEYGITAAKCLLDAQTIKRALKHASGAVGFIFSSERVKKEFCRVIDFNDIPSAVIPRPIDTEAFGDIARPEGTRKNCLVLERFKHGKAGEACINAVFSLRFVPEFPKTRILFVGEGKRFIDGTRQLKPYNNISVLNRIPDERGINKLIATNGLLLHPVNTLAQSIMLTCAMASGMVVITQDKGMSELIEHGETGYIANSPIALGTCMESIWNDTLNFTLVSQKAKAAVRAKCSIKSVCAEEAGFFNTNPQ